MNKIFLAVSLFLLISFVFLSKYEDRAIVKLMDFAATVKIQDRIDKSVHLRLAALVDNVMEGSSFFASPEFASIVVLLLTALTFKTKKWRALVIPAAFILIVLVEIYGKTVVHHPSPPFAMIKHTTSVFPANYINEEFSYPSGHAARAVFIAITAWFIVKKRWVSFALALYVLLVAISRIYLGHHWPSDVIGGALLGAGLGILTI
jgi:membrane-associated phospholipid phosphatase